MTKEKTKEKKTTNQPFRKKGYEKRLAKKLAKLALEKKAFDVTLLDLRKLTTMTDFFVLCSADSDTQVKAIVDHLQDEMKKQHLKPWHREGYEKLRWVLLDFVDVVVHVFQAEVREFYKLEALWGDAKLEKITDTVPKVENREVVEE